jgi:hypothetical protein
MTATVGAGPKETLAAPLRVEEAQRRPLLPAAPGSRR